VRVPAPAPPALEARLERRSEAPPTPLAEAAFLAPGLLASPLRPVVERLQAALCTLALPLALAGALVLARRDWRRALLLLSVSLYYLLSESPFIYEWRVVAPMHYGLLAAAAAAVVALPALARRVRR
jgi:hypothetical protein